MVYFDGASNVQKAGRILERRFPRITSGSAAEHTTSLFFDDIFNKIPEYCEAKVLCSKLRNVFCSQMNFLFIFTRMKSRLLLGLG